MPRKDLALEANIFSFFFSRSFSLPFFRAVSVAMYGACAFSPIALHGRQCIIALCAHFYKKQSETFLWSFVRWK